jgi:hypothetical protein
MDTAPTTVQTPEDLQTSAPVQTSESLQTPAVDVSPPPGDTQAPSASLLRSAEKQPGGATGKGFQPGQTGNPGGRPKGLAALVRERTDSGRTLVEFMINVLDGVPFPMVKRVPQKDAAGKVTGYREVHFEGTPDLDQRMEAAAWLANRGWGQPKVVFDGEMRLPVQLIVRAGLDPLADGNGHREALGVPTNGRALATPVRAPQRQAFNALPPPQEEP